MDYLLYFFIVFFIVLIPAFITLVFEVAIFGRIWQKGLTLIKVLSSYGIYSICLVISAVTEPLDFYMHNNCAWTSEEVAPCSSAMYSVASFVESWLFVTMLVVALVIQLAYLHFICRYIKFNKLSQQDAASGASA